VYKRQYKGFLVWIIPQRVNLMNSKSMLIQLILSTIVFNTLLDVSFHY